MPIIISNERAYMMKRIICLCIAIAMLGTTGCSSKEVSQKPQTNVKKEAFKENEESSQKSQAKEKMLTVEEILEDLEFMKTVYMANNLSMREQELVDEFTEKHSSLVSSITEPMSVNDFYIEVSKLAALTDDGHARVSFTNNSRVIPVKFKWIEDSLVVSKTIRIDNLSKGDKVLSIGGVKIDEIVKKVGEITPSENDYGLKMSVAMSVSNEYILDYLGVIDDNNQVALEIQKLDGNVVSYTFDFIEMPGKRNGQPKGQTPKQDEKQTKEQGIKRNKTNSKNKLPDELNPNLNPNAPRPAVMKPSTITTRILAESDTGILKIGNCSYDKAAEQAFNDFFKEVKEKQIDTIVIDLRDNMGGKMDIIVELLKYIDVDEVQLWKNDLADDATKVIEHPTDFTYDGEIYVATNNSTLSAALMLTATLKYNDLATTIGEPTGQSTLFYGQAGSAMLKNSGISIGTTRVKVYLQNEDLPNTMVPDIKLPLSIEDFANNNDPLLEWIKSH